MDTSSAPGYPSPGATIGRYRLVEKLGQGGMGVVFRAWEGEPLNRWVALKIIAPHFAHDPDFRRRFNREARAQASLGSTHVVPVFAHGEEDGCLYIATQLIDGGDLGQLISTSGVPPLVDALDIVQQVASGLADVHAAGLVHRDIKPGNVLTRIRHGEVEAYLADFGIARRVDADGTVVGGTPQYMAPELYVGAAATASSDIYALGCLLWLVLTGRPPYPGEDPLQNVAAHANQPVPQLRGDSPMVNAVNRILRSSLAKDPRDRYQSAHAMRADLRAVLRLPHDPGRGVPDPAQGSMSDVTVPAGHGPDRGQWESGGTGPGGPKRAHWRWAVPAAIVVLVLAAWALSAQGGETPRESTGSDSPLGTLDGDPSDIVEFTDPAEQIASEADAVAYLLPGLTGTGADCVEDQIDLDAVLHPVTHAASAEDVSSLVQDCVEPGSIGKLVGMYAVGFNANGGDQYVDLSDCAATEFADQSSAVRLKVVGDIFEKRLDLYGPLDSPGVAADAVARYTSCATAEPDIPGEETEAPQDPSDTATPTKRPGKTNKRVVPWNLLQPGDCLVALPSGTFEQVTVVGCGVPHRHEVVGGSFTDAGATKTQIADQCRNLFASYSGRTAAKAGYDLTWLVPEPGTLSARLICMGTPAGGGTTTGSLR